MEEQRIQLAFASADAGYVRRVVDYVRDSPFADRWQLTAFTNGAALRHYLRGGFRVDMVAADAAMRGELEAAGEWPAVPVAALCETLGENMPVEARAVKRLQPLPQLFHALYGLYAEKSVIRRPAAGASGPVVAAVYAASGGAGKTTLAVHLAYQSALSGSRTFYLNLETWNASDVWLEGGDRGTDSQTDGFAQLLYTLQSMPEQASSRLAAFCRTDAVMRFDYFEPCRNPEERMALQPQAAAQLIEAIAGSGLYDLIVIDLDGGADVLHMAVFERCSHLFYVEEGTMTSIKKAECFLRYGRERWGEAFQAIERKMVSIRRMPAPAAASEAVSGEALRIAGLIDGRGRGHLPKLPEIPFIESWRTRGDGRMLPSTRYRSMAERLLQAAGIGPGAKEHVS
ncbi:conserved hypothetical protein [Paenibacillus curdlanolyticus YK9]|uniref:AAA domain-containing protein n=1 Tax=Paenibacillus curdlanolyticus YK9 TaxID=717606 RepID=E0I6U2_9BACL|nr:hypothetical protein [Paenibacillus curdlanolyticus]EFM11758.1 conserved hypothetical protein [Paenibacillus curdlanolyticus YK9]